MASLTSVDLHTRLSVSPLRWQFETADNPYDLNWVLTRLSLKGRHGRSRQVQTRVVVWELADVAGICDRLAAGTRSNWQSRLMDSGLHLFIRRTGDRGDTFSVVALAAADGGPLPADYVPSWRNEWLDTPGAGVWGIRMTCSRGALGLFAHELEAELQTWAPRPWVRPDNGALEMPAAALEWAERQRKVEQSGGR